MILSPVVCIRHVATPHPKNIRATIEGYEHHPVLVAPAEGAVELTLSSHGLDDLLGVFGAPARRRVPKDTVARGKAASGDAGDLRGGLIGWLVGWLESWLACLLRGCGRLTAQQSGPELVGSLSRLLGSFKSSFMWHVAGCDKGEQRRYNT